MHPELPQEQAYFDRALALSNRLGTDVERPGDVATDPVAAAELRRKVRPLGLASPAEAVAFGRIRANGNRWYVGRNAIWDGADELVVVNWQAPVAAPFYTATADDPAGLDERRLFHCDGNRIREIEDHIFRGTEEAIANGRAPTPVLVDPLLETLDRGRSGELGDIVATIQAAQYEVISAPADQLLVVQGGPGTGKTVVGLHRVSWLLFNHRDRLTDNDVLVVGPNPSFMRYVSSVLPSLGDDAVVQVPLSALGPRVRVGRVDPLETRRLKGDRRLVRVIRRGLRHRQRITAGPVELTVDGRRVHLDGDRIAQRARQLAGRPHNDVHRELRTFLLAEVRALLADDAVSDAPARAVAVRTASVHAVEGYLERAWPNLTPQSFLIGLFSDPRQLGVAAGGSLTEEEVGLLLIPPDARVGTWHWSVEDVPLLDAADVLVNGAPPTYEHVVVDEAQDLSPLQLESIRRRSRTGAMTVLGDLAQGTGPWAHSSWDDVIDLLAHEEVPVTTAELQLGYRLPREVHELAVRLLSDAAPGVRPPRALRRSGHEVQVVGAGPSGLARSAAVTVRSLVGTGLIGVIAPDSERNAVVEAFDDAGITWSRELRVVGAPVVVISPEQCRGLEFDTVVVVEPAQIVAEAEHGERALYVALTRCTNRLAIVHDAPLPVAIASHETAPGLRPIQTPPGLAGERNERATPEGVHAWVIGDDVPTLAVPVARDDDRPDHAVVGDPVEGDEGTDDEATVGAAGRVGGERHVRRPATEPEPTWPVDHDEPRPARRNGRGAQGLGRADFLPPTGERRHGSDQAGVRGTEPEPAGAPRAAPRSGVGPRATPEPVAAPRVERKSPATQRAGPESAGAPRLERDSRVGRRAGPEPAAAPVRPGPASVDESSQVSGSSEPFAELDRAIAHAIAKALTDKLARYATAELLPLVAEEMVRVIGRRSAASGTTSAPGGRTSDRGDPGR
jgi:hypothetical protein